MIMVVVVVVVVVVVGGTVLLGTRDFLDALINNNPVIILKN